MALGELSALIRAVARLHPSGEIDPELIQALSRLIAPARVTARPARAASEPRLGGATTSADTTPRAARAQSPLDRSPPVSGAREGDRDRPGRGRSAERAEDDRLQAIESVLELIIEQADLLPDRQPGATHEAERGGAEPELRVASVPVEALFPPGRVRAVLREMATVPTPCGAPDLHKAVELIAHAKPILALPRALVGTLPHSIHWVFEAGPSMLPYVRDKQQLARTVTRLLGEDRVRLGDFIADPLKGVRPRGQVKWRSLHWPGARSALVVVSDLGIGGGETVDALAESIWPMFLDQARQRGVSTVLLNPYGQDQWPDVASAFDIALTWDADTGVQSLRRTRRRRRAH